MWLGRKSKSCFSSDTCCVTLVQSPGISHERGKKGRIMTNRTYPYNSTKFHQRILSFLSDEERCRKNAFLTSIGQYCFTIPVSIMNSDAPFVCIVDKINDTETLLILQMILVYVVKAKHLIDVIESF